MEPIALCLSVSLHICWHREMAYEHCLVVLQLCTAQWPRHSVTCSVLADRRFDTPVWYRTPINGFKSRVIEL